MATTKQTDFASLPLAPELLAVIQELGYEKMTAIQAKSLPVLLAGRDLVGQAQTGSGKTLAFALPILQKLSHDEKAVQALILCPSRELATQVVGEFRKLGRRQDGVQVVALTGGVPSAPQAQALENGAQIAVGTPGRILDLIQKRRLDLSGLKTLVLDEADRMFDMGFELEVQAILKTIPPARQTLFFSATYPESIELLSKRHQKNPLFISVEGAKDSPPPIEQFVYEAEREDKMQVLLRVLQQHPANTAIVFCNMKASVAELAEKFEELKISCGSLHGDLDQRERDRVMAAFRNGSQRILFATDVAARGLDIENLELVVNYDLPLQPEVYVHRIGRTGRAGRAGVAVSLATPRDGLKVLEFERLTGQKVQRPVLGFKKQFGLPKELRESVMKTLSISGGRKDKLRPGDILGALTGEAGGLKASDIGKIEVQDTISFVAINSQVVETAFDRLREGRIKGKKFQIRIVK